MTSSSSKDSSASQPGNTTTKSSQAGNDAVDITATSPTTLGELKDMLKMLLKKSTEQENKLKVLTTASKMRKKGGARRSFRRFKPHGLSFSMPRTAQRTRSDLPLPPSLRAADPTLKQTNETMGTRPAASGGIAHERQAASRRIAHERQAASRRIAQKSQAASGGIVQMVDTDDNPCRTRTSGKHSAPAWIDRSQARQNSADIKHDQDLAANKEEDLYLTKKFELEQERKALLQTQNDEMAKMQAQLERIASDLRVAQSKMNRFNTQDVQSNARYIQSLEHSFASIWESFEREITSTNEHITELTTYLNITAIKAHQAEIKLNRITNNRHVVTRYYNSNVRAHLFHEGDSVHQEVFQNTVERSAKKLEGNCDGPPKITKVARPGVYEHENMTVALIPRSWNARHLKK